MVVTKALNNQVAPKILKRKKKKPNPQSPCQGAPWAPPAAPQGVCSPVPRWWAGCLPAQSTISPRTARFDADSEMWPKITDVAEEYYVSFVEK